MTPLRSLPDLLVFLPYHVGFELRDALVVLGLDGPRLALVERADLPNARPLPPDALARLVGGVRRLAPHLDAVLVVGYATDADPEPALPLLADALAGVVPVVRPVLVAERTWREWGEDAARPLPDPADVPLVAEYVGRGVAPLADRAALRTALARTPAPHIEAAVRATHGIDPAEGFRAWDRLVGARLAPAGPLDPFRPLTPLDPAPRPDVGAASADTAPAIAPSTVAVAGALTTPAVVPALGSVPAPELSDVVTTLAFVADVSHRDALLTRLVPLGAAPPDATSGFVEETASDTGGPAPSEDLDALAVRVAVRATLVGLARVAPRPLRATTLSMLAVWAWHCGDGALAAVASAVALEEEPGHGLADVVAHLVRLDVPPPGAR